jgi:hypothetical protein
VSHIPASGFNSIEPAEYANGETFKNTIKMNEITAQAGAEKEFLRLGSESNRLNEI